MIGKERYALIKHGWHILFYNIFPTKSRKDTTVDDYWESQSCVIPYSAVLVVMPWYVVDDA